MIPIRNIFYLLVYAWDLAADIDEAEVGQIEADRVENLLAVLLTRQIDRLLRRGAEQQYVEANSDSKCIRGRIDFQQTAKRYLRRRFEAHIRSDELSSDTLSNQIIKAAIARLTGSDRLALPNREELCGLRYTLKDISGIRLTGGDFRRVRLHANNRHYRVVLALCEMIFYLSLPDERGTGTRFVRVDRRGMWRIFQKFLLNFYGIKGRALSLVRSAQAETLPWRDSVAPKEAGVQLPTLATDVVLQTATGKILIEAKYYKEPFVVGRFGNTSLRPAHLNQIFAYMQNLAPRGTEPDHLRGVLLYAGTSGKFRHRFRVFGKQVDVAGVDLSSEWADIENQLLDLVRS